MKSRLMTMLTLAFLLPFLGIAQQIDSPCNFLPYSIFKGASTQKPVLLNKLGTSPQFGEIAKHTGMGAYSHLKDVYKKNKKGSRKEIDDLLKALGFSGFYDPAFSAKNLIPEILPAGTTGWMGAYGHKYVWSTLGRPFETFKVYSKSGECFLYIMKKCGNAFYMPSYITPAAVLPAMACKSQTVTVSGEGQLSSGDVLNTSKTMEIIAVNNSAKGTRGLLLGSFPVAIRSTYDFNLKGSAQYSKSLPVCVLANSTPAALSISLPMNLNYVISKSEVKIGEGDKIYLNVDDKKYAALSKAFKSVAVAAANTSNLEVASKKITAAPASDFQASAANGTKCADQKINFLSKTQVIDGSVKSLTQDVTIIGVYKKAGKLAKGETAEKYLCLGNFQVPIKSAYEFNASAGSDVSQIFSVCSEDGLAKADQNVSIPVNLTYNFSKQDVVLGDYNKIYVPLTEKEYNALSKNYNRCCTEGGEGSCK